MKQKRIEFLVLFAIWLVLLLSTIGGGTISPVFFKSHVEAYELAGDTFHLFWNVHFRIIIDFILYGLAFILFYSYLAPLLFKKKSSLLLFLLTLALVALISLINAWVYGAIDPFFYYTEGLINRLYNGKELQRFQIYYNHTSNYIMTVVGLALSSYFIKYLVFHIEQGKQLFRWFTKHIKQYLTTAVTVFTIALITILAINGVDDYEYFTAFYTASMLAITFTIMAIPFWYFLLNKHQTPRNKYDAIGLYLTLGFCVFSMVFVLPVLRERVGIYYSGTPMSNALELYIPILLHPILTAGLPFIIFIFNKKNIGAQQELLTRESKAKTELEFLKSQINPHFLFNSLNTVYGLALQDGSHKTAEGINQLSRMMRFMLHENNSERISLDKEVLYLKDYIDFQRLRLDDDIPVTFNAPFQIPEIKIAPMILIPLVENAFKYGVKMNAKSWIEINLSIKESSLELNVKNSLHLKDELTEKSEVGINNLLGRLNLMYLEKHTFHVYENEGTYETKLTLELND